MHYLTLVLVRQSVGDVAGRVDRLLRGSEGYPHRTYDEYSKSCLCIGSRAREFGFEQFDSTPRGKEVGDLLDEIRDREDSKAERALLGERFKAAAAIAAQHPDFERPDPNCSSCRGTGTTMGSRSGLSLRLVVDRWPLGWTFRWCC